MLLPPPEVVFVTLHAQISDPENTTPVDLSRTAQVIVCEVEFVLGVRHTRVLDPVYVEPVDVSPAPHLIEYSRFAGIAIDPVAAHVYVTSTFGERVEPLGSDVSVSHDRRVEGGVTTHAGS